MNLTPVHLVSLIAALALVPSPATAQHCTEGVDWTARIVCAKGIGAVNPNLPPSAARPGAIRVAHQVALRNALELVKGIQINSSTSIENSMLTSDVVRSRVEGFVRGFEFGQPHYMDDMTIEVYVRLPLDGLTEIALPASVQQEPQVRQWSWRGGGGQPASRPSNLASSIFTGLIVDARGQGAIPALAPRILAPDGEVLYGEANVSREWVVRHGMAGYAKTPEQARGQTDRIGTNPALLRATGTQGAARTDVVISAEDALRLKSASENLTFLSQARVIILVD